MQVSKLIVALTVAAGFTSASFAQGNATLTAPATPAAKVSAPAPATAEKKVEAPKTSDAKPAAHHDKANDHAKKAEHKPEVKAEVKTSTPAPASKS
jgi:hypothetical protein